MDDNTVMFLVAFLVPISLWVLKEFIKDFPVLFGKDEELDRRWEEARIRVSDVGVLSVDSNELVRSKAGQEQIEALERMTKGE